jgi:hypothetical protein
MNRSKVFSFSWVEKWKDVLIPLFFACIAFILINFLGFLAAALAGMPY